MRWRREKRGNKWKAAVDGELMRKKISLKLRGVFFKYKCYGKIYINRVTLTERLWKNAFSNFYGNYMRKNIFKSFHFLF